MKWCLGTLRYEGDRHAVVAVSTQPDMFTRDPVLSADYIITTAREDREAVDAVTEIVLDAHTHPASRLHGLRYLARAGLGRLAGLEVLEMARDQTLPAPVRTWAWTAYGASKAMNRLEVGDTVDIETSVEVCRAAVLTLHHGDGRRGQKFVARRALRRFPELRPTTKWAAEVTLAA